jgi:hypothetical protein
LTVKKISLLPFLTLIGYAFFSPPFAVHGQPTGWSVPEGLSNPAESALFPDLTVDHQGYLHAVWVEDFNGIGYGDTVFYSRWDGSSWSRPVDIFFELDGLTLPNIAVDNWGLVHAIWPHTWGSGVYYIHASVAEALRAPGWSRATDIASERKAYFADLASDERETIHVVWEDRADPPSTNSLLYYARSEAGGQPWTTPIDIANVDTSFTVPRMAVDNQGVIHVVAMQETEGSGDYVGDLGIAYLRSADGGRTWEKLVRISADGERAGAPGIAVDDGGNAHVVWVQGLGMYYRRWDGTAWSGINKFADLKEYKDGAWPQIAVDGAGGLHVVWFDPGRSAIYYSYSSDGGGRWSRPEMVAQGGAWRVSIAVTLGNQLHAVWGERRSPGRGGQVFHSFKLLPLPAQTPAALPVATFTPFSAPTRRPTATPVPTSQPTPTRLAWTPGPPMPPNGAQQVSWPIIAGITPVLALLGVVVLFRAVWRKES